MSFDKSKMIELAARGPVARVVVADTRGSVPREIGAAMMVTADEVFGTIGGGALEFEAIARARECMKSQRSRLDRYPLGPALKQCCGGSVTVLTECWTRESLEEIDHVSVRPLPNKSIEMPLSVKRVCAAYRSSGSSPKPGMMDGWMVEPVCVVEREIWVWGAGHVGRAIVGALSPLPRLKICWADSASDRFPSQHPENVDKLIAENPADLVTLSGPAAEHLVVTYSHAMDLEICHRVLSRSFRTLGVVGSKTKRARFRSRLQALGHSKAQIDRMICPIGDPSLGKHPQEIALGVAADIVRVGNGGLGMIGARA